MARAGIGGERYGVVLPLTSIGREGVDRHKTVGVEYIAHHTHHQSSMRGIAAKVCPKVDKQPIGSEASIVGIDGRHGCLTVEGVGGIEAERITVAMAHTTAGSRIVAADGGMTSPVIGEAIVAQAVEIGAIGYVDPSVQGLFA